MAQNNLGVLDGLRIDRSVGRLAAALSADPGSQVAQRNLHRLITLLTYNLYIGEAVVFAVAAVLAIADHGPSTASRILGVAAFAAAAAYVVSVVRQVPRGAWRHTTRRFGVPKTALWNLVPLTLVAIFIVLACFTDHAVGVAHDAAAPVVALVVMLLRRRLRRS
jgi:small-conductance mechanosensitive channel